MAMMTPENFVAHVDNEVARKFATDILNLLDKPEPEAKPKPEAEKKSEEEEEEEEK